MPEYLVELDDVASHGSAAFDAVGDGTASWPGAEGVSQAA
jgi:hypothetical protein